jgi:hypothetical protein
MRYVHRELEKQVVGAMRDFPVVVLTGARRAGLSGGFSRR